MRLLDLHGARVALHSTVTDVLDARVVRMTQDQVKSPKTTSSKCNQVNVGELTMRASCSCPMAVSVFRPCCRAALTCHPAKRQSISTPRRGTLREMKTTEVGRITACWRAVVSRFSVAFRSAVVISCSHSHQSFPSSDRPGWH